MDKIIELLLQLFWVTGEIIEIIDNSEREKNFYQETDSEPKSPPVSKKWEALGRIKIGKLKKSKKRKH